MKLFLFILFPLILSLPCLAQETNTNYRCSCHTIGFDTIWADTNNISCYLIPVERNYSKPRGQQYNLAVAVAPAINVSPKDPLLYLHGGPGIATLSNFPRYLKSKTFSQIRENHALVFFDYRGTGFSEPALCPGLNDTVNAISNARLPLEQEISAIATAYAACKADALKLDIHVSDFSSLQSASDAESIRKVLNIKNWNIYSVSHGTTVALNMMRSFPDHITSVILDSPFPPNAPWIDFIRPFDTAFTVLEKHIAQDSVSSLLFPNIKEDYNKIISRLRTQQFLFPAKPENGVASQQNFFDDSDFTWSVWSAMLDPYYIELIPLALQEIANGNDSILLQWALYFDDPNAFGQFDLAQSDAILQYESKPRFKQETEKQLLLHFPEYASFIIPGLNDALYKNYRPESPPKKYFEGVQSAIPTLIFAGEFDPVCPPLFAEITSASLTHSTVIIVPAASHASMFTDDCTRIIGKEFYLNPYVKPETRCVFERKKIEFVRSGIRDYLK